MKGEFEQLILQREITRLCHFTSSRTLSHMLCTGTGVLATKRLKSDERAVYNPNDLHRFDGLDSHVCCSVEYPNSWFFKKTKDQQPLFRDWVVLFLRPQLISKVGVMFCWTNAASRRGSAMRSGVDGFKRLFEKNVTDNARCPTRGALHLSCSPTDDQAEVLIPDEVALSDLLAFAVRDEAQARRELLRLDLLGVPRTHINIIIAPVLFGPPADLASQIRRGRRPTEYVWDTKCL